MVLIREHSLIFNYVCSLRTDMKNDENNAKVSGRVGRG